MRASVLLADSDMLLCQKISDYLGGEGIAVTSVSKGSAVPTKLAETDFDAVILAAAMPEKGGFELLREFHGGHYPPTIMLSGRRDDVDRLLSYELGADVFLDKPFQLRELLVRLNALLRRVRLCEQPASNALGNLVLCEISRQATVNGVQLTLTAAEYRILARLIRHQGESQSRDLLCETVLSRRCRPGDRSIDTHVSNLRKKLRTAGACGLRIVSERHRGYTIVPA